MRFAATCYRLHDPRWAFKPLSGDGAARRGARFNPRGTPALYLALTVEGAVREIAQGFASKMDPCLLVSYDVDCGDIVDLRTDGDRTAAGVKIADMNCAWAADLADGRTPASWGVATRLMAKGAAGILVPSFAAHALPTDRNLVLWKWGPDRPQKVRAYDPTGRLPKNQLSWK